MLLKRTAHARCSSGARAVLSSGNTWSVAVALQVKNLPVSQQHELSSQRNFLTSEIAVCVLLSTSHTQCMPLWKQRVSRRSHCQGKKVLMENKVRRSGEKLSKHCSICVSNRGFGVLGGWWERTLITWRVKVSSRKDHISLPNVLAVDEIWPTFHPLCWQCHETVTGMFRRFLLPCITSVFQRKRRQR